MYSIARDLGTRNKTGERDQVVRVSLKSLTLLTDDRRLCEGHSTC